MRSAQDRSLRRSQRAVRHFSLILLRFGVTAEGVAIAGMLFGLLAGGAFLWTANAVNPAHYWLLGLIASLLRLLLTLAGEAINQTHPHRGEFEDETYRQIPERVSDAVTLIGLGFAIHSNSWLGLSAALLATLSSYLRSLRETHPHKGLMKRTHRLGVVILTSCLMLAGITHVSGGYAVPSLALGLITAGCAITIVLRWLDVENRIAP